MLVFRVLACKTGGTSADKAEVSQSYCYTFPSHYQTASEVGQCGEP